MKGLMDDERIIALFFARDEAALEAFAQKYRPLCRKLARDITGSEELAEECLNDLYLRLWNSIPPERPAALKSYACRIVRNLALNCLDRERAGKRAGILVELDECAEAIPEAETGEITALINTDLHENAYETQAAQPYTYRTEGLAEGLENFLLLCPKCGSYDSMKTEGDRFTCTCCGLGGVYDEHGYLVGEDLPFRQVNDWGRWIAERFDEQMAEKQVGELLFTETETRLYEINKDHSTTDLDTGDVKIYKDKFVLGEREFAFEDITAMSLLYYGKSVLFTHQRRYYGITGEHFHAWKIERLYGIHNKEK